MNATAQHELAPFTWDEISLSETTYVNGIPHPTRKAIGELLEYTDPQKGIDHILARNPHIERHSIPVNLSGMPGGIPPNLGGMPGRNYETKVYHPIGFLMIVMESEQPKAKKMKEAVAEFVWSFAGPKPHTQKERMELMKHRRILIIDLSKTVDACAREMLLADLYAVSLELGMSVPKALARQLQLPI